MTIQTYKRVYINILDMSRKNFFKLFFFFLLSEGKDEEIDKKCLYERKFIFSFFPILLQGEVEEDEK